MHPGWKARLGWTAAALGVFAAWALVSLTVTLPSPAQVPWPGGVGWQHVYVPDQIATAVAHAEKRLNEDWAQCLRCLKLAVGGEASNLSGHRSFDAPLPPVPPTFGGSEFEFVMPFPSGATLRVLMRRDPTYRVEWRPAHPTRPGGLPYRVTTAAGEVECPDGLSAVFVASRNGK